MAYANTKQTFAVREGTTDCQRRGSSHSNKDDASQKDHESVDIFREADKATFTLNVQNKRDPETDHERKARPHERREGQRSASQRSFQHAADVITKTELIRASAKRVQTERHRNSPSDNERINATKPNRAGSSSVRSTDSSNSSDRTTHSRGQSSFTEHSDLQRTSPRSPQRNGSVSPGGRVSPKHSLSASPKHHSSHRTNSKTSLVSKPSSSITSSPRRSYSDSQSGVTTALLPRKKVNSSHGYSKPAMEVAVSALVFVGGLITLIVALIIIGSKAWIIVGSISMGIGGVFIGFGAYFYFSRPTPMMGTRELFEIQLVDIKQLAELSSDGFKVDL